MISFLDIKKINDRHKTAFSKSLDDVVEGGNYILGQHTIKFESQFANYCGTKYCIGTGNGLDALTLILKGYIELGELQIGDKVIVPANTFIATILSVLHAGLVPVFIEPNESTFNLSEENVRRALSAEIKAIIVVHLYGQISEIEELIELKNIHNILLIEDAAQAHGSVTNKGLKAGSLADAAAFSFYPTKNLGALGDAGAITTNDTALNETVLKLRNYGSSKKYENSIIGFNSRLDELQAAFLSEKLNYLDEDNLKRRKIAKRYSEEIVNPKIRLPWVRFQNSHVFYVYPIRVKHRELFTLFLKERGVETMVHYPIAPHRQKALEQFQNLNLPITDAIHNSVVSLPISPVMDADEVSKVIETVNSY